MSNTYQVDDYEVTIPSKLAQKAAAGIAELWVRYGRPEDLSTDSGLLLFDQVVDMWKTLYPDDFHGSIAATTLHQSAEKDLSSLAKLPGYQMAKYPTSLYNILKKVFPKVNWGDKKVIKKITSRHPWMKLTKYKI